MFLGSLIALIAGVSLPAFGIWMTKKWIERMAPNPNYLATTVKGDVASAVNFLMKAVAMAIWAFFGLTIVYMTPGAPSQKQTVVYLDTQTVTTPELELQIDSVSTKENVLIVVIKNGNPSMGGSPSMGMGMEGGMGMGMPGGGEMGMSEGGGGYGMGSMSEMGVENAVRLQVEFRGEFLPAEAQVLAAESHEGKYFFPGEPSDIITLPGKGTLALAFAFPNSATAIACMNKIRREQARRNQGMGMGGGMGMGMGMGDHSIANGQLFSINGGFGGSVYEAFVKPVP